MKKLLAMLPFLVASTSLLADGPGWTEFSKVTQLVVTSNGGINVRLEPNLNGCVSQSGYGEHYASIYSSHVGLDRIYSTLLASYVNGKKVSLYLTDSACKVLEIRTERLN